jgi:superfamily II DNA or RNA helicase
MGFRDRNFFLWGECSPARNVRDDSCSAQSASRGGAANHTGDPGAERLVRALAGIGFRRVSVDGARGMGILLPTLGEAHPIPSSPLLGEIPATSINCPAAPHMREWRVETLPVEPVDVLDFVPVLSEGGGVSPDGLLVAYGIMSALDLYYVAECARFAMSLLGRACLLPDIRRIKRPDGDERYESFWRPVLFGGDAVRFENMARAMPDILRSYELPAGPLPASEVLYEMLGSMIDSAVRHSWTKKIDDTLSGRDDMEERLTRALIGLKNTDQDHLALERRSKGKIVNSLNPHSLWARSLGWIGETEGLCQSLKSIYPDAREWWDRFEWLAKAPFKVYLSMKTPGDEDGAWRLEYVMRFRNTGESVSVREVWGQFGDSRGSYMRRYLLMMLGLAGLIVEPILRSLEDRVPDGCEMTRDEAAAFLSVHAKDLEGKGVGIIYPDWWLERSTCPLTLRGRLISRERAVRPRYEAGAAPHANSVRRLKVRWEFAVGGVILSDDERVAVLEEGKSLVWIRGRWRSVAPAHAMAVRRHGESLPVEGTAEELVRLAVKDRHIDGFTDAPELEKIYNALRDGMIPEPPAAPDGMRCSLRPYQSAGYSWLSFLSGLGLGACLADDMGLGKTIQTLAMIQSHRDKGERRPVLLVCPTSVIENWRIEVERFFPGLSTYVQHGRLRKRGLEFMRAIADRAVVLTSYALLQRDLTLYQGINWQGIVLDEAQNIKNPDARQSKAARAIRSDWRVALTGTPIENHAGDLWPIMEFLVPGMLGSRRSFSNSYVKPIQERRDATLMEDLRHRISPFILRRMKTDDDIAPELPRKTETRVYCGLKKEQAALYSDVAESLGRKLSGVLGMRRRGLVIVALTRAKQICDHPSLVTKDGDFEVTRSAKLERLFSLAEEMHETGDKVLIFTQYAEMGSIMKDQLQERFGRETLFLHGSVPRDARDRMVRRFQEEPGPRFFVLSLRAGGTGLNLTEANHVVMYDRWWNPAVEAQAIDRAYRIGQKRNVHVHLFCCRGTVEERIDEIIESKKDVANRIIEGNDDWITELSDSDIMRLLFLRPTATEV